MNGPRCWRSTRLTKASTNLLKFVRQYTARAILAFIASDISFMTLAPLQNIWRIPNQAAVGSTHWWPFIFTLQPRNQTLIATVEL